MSATFKPPPIPQFILTDGCDADPHLVPYDQVNEADSGQTALIVGCCGPHPVSLRKAVIRDTFQVGNKPKAVENVIPILGEGRITLAFRSNKGSHGRL